MLYGFPSVLFQLFIDWGVCLCVYGGPSFSSHYVVGLGNAVQVTGRLNLLSHLTSPTVVLLHNYV